MSLCTTFSSSLYQMLQPTMQRPVYQLRTVQCGTVIAFGV